MGPLLDRLVAEREVISQAPVTFVIVSVLLLVISFLLAKFWFAHQMENLRSTIARHESTIADYERKLDGASPEEAKARLDSLERQVAALQAELTELGSTDFVAKFDEAVKGRDIDGGTF